MSFMPLNFPTGQVLFNNIQLNSDNQSCVCVAGVRPPPPGVLSAPPPPPPPGVKTNLSWQPQPTAPAASQQATPQNVPPPSELSYTSNCKMQNCKLQNVNIVGPLWSSFYTLFLKIRFYYAEFYQKSYLVAVEQCSFMLSFMFLS